MPAFRRRLGAVAVVTVTAVAATAALVSAAGPAAAADRVDLTSAASFAVLAGTTVTNGAVGGASTTHISGDVGVSPGSAVTGLTAHMVSNGSVHSNDAQAIAAQAGLSTAYNEAATPPPGSGAVTLGGRRLLAGSSAGRRWR